VIHAKALDLLEQAPNGYRYGALHAALVSALPEIPGNTIHGNIWNLETSFPDKVLKPARGLFLHAKYHDSAALDAMPIEPPKAEKIREEKFYEPFAKWLVEELEECTKAVSIGGSRFKDKWGTPDVIGIREPRKSDIIKPPTEIVSAEIKLDALGLIVAFGQACSYKLFSHKSYIVVPRDSPEEDIARLDALCLIFGIGLILFDAKSPSSPDFDIRVRAARHEPDMFYVNQKMKLVEDDLFV
jgi:hypothetical protein